MWRPSTLVLILALAAPGPVGAQLSSEHFFRKGSLSLTVSAGGAAFSDFLRAVEQPDADSLRFERRLSAGTTGVIGAELVWWLGGALGVRAHASYMPSRFAVQYDREGEEWLRDQSVSAQSPAYARLRIWAADVSALLRPQVTLGRVSPYGILGAGIISYRPQSARDLPPEAEAAFTGGARTSPAAVLGVGATLPLQKGDMLLSFAVTDHITRTPVRAPDATTTWRDRRNVSSLYPSEQGGSVWFTSNVRLMVGLTFPLSSR